VATVGLQLRRTAAKATHSQELAAESNCPTVRGFHVTIRFAQQALAGGTGTNGAPAPAAGNAGGTQNYPTDPTTQSFLQQLQQRAHQSLEVGANDPIIKGQTDAFRAEGERARRNFLGDAAESGSPYATGAQQGQARMSAEKLGQNVGGFQAELMGRELTARRDEIQQALATMGSTLSEHDRQALQKELALIDDSTKRYGINTQNSQFYAGLSQNDKHFYDQLSQADRLAMMDDSFRRDQLGQNDTQFRDTLGFNTADRTAYWDAVNRGLV
jgi:hypothetical protein